MKEINEKDLGKATGGLYENRVRPSDKCDRWEASSESVKSLPEMFRQCGNCLHFGGVDVHDCICKLR